MVFRRHRAVRASAQRVLDAAHARLGPQGTLLPPPSLAEVREAIVDVAAGRNGYQAWSLYSVMRQQPDVQLTAADVTELAGAMLHVDHELHADVAARRTLSVLDAERQSGRPVLRQLLAHGAAACALRGLPELAEALCVEAEALPVLPRLPATGAANRADHFLANARHVDHVATGDYRDGVFVDFPRLERGTTLVGAPAKAFSVGEKPTPAAADPRLTLYALAAAPSDAVGAGGLVADRPTSLTAMGAPTLRVHVPPVRSSAPRRAWAWP